MTTEIEGKNRAYLRECYRLAKQVERWFQEAVEGKRAHVPDLDGCLYVAGALLVSQHHQEHRREPPPEALKLKKAWDRLRRELKHFSDGRPEFEEGSREVKRHMAWLLLLAGALPPRDPIRFIADAAKYAWEDSAMRREAAGEKSAVPRSVAPDDAVCAFVGRALDYLRILRAPETISAVLRGRRRQR